VPTINDVARAAGVSASTVSYVLSGKRPISTPTRNRVEKAIAELNYRPHAGARALASQRTNVIGLMAPLRIDVNVNIIMQFVAGVVTSARAFDHDVLLLTQDETTGLDRVASGSMVDALVVMDIEAEDPRVPILAALKQPTVLIGLPKHAQGLSCVDLDFDETGRLAVGYLADQGHRTIGFIGSPPVVIERHTTYAERLLRGFNSESAERDLRTVHIPCESSQVGAQIAVDALLTAMPDVTAVVVHNEVALAHIVSHLRSRGHRTPENIAILAICPADVAEAQPIPLTAIDFPTHAIGQIAVEMVMARLDGDRPAETRLLAPKVIERGSTHAPPGAGAEV
jgi:DNA-binding LacI/PurR family transcriptional regulator